MKCIIVDDEPIARKGIRSLIARVPELELMEMFNNASSAAIYLTSPGRPRLSRRTDARYHGNRVRLEYF